MLTRLRADDNEAVLTVLRSLPKRVVMMSACSGTGIFELCVRALVKTMELHSKDEDDEDFNWDAAHLYLQ